MRPNNAARNFHFTHSSLRYITQGEARQVLVAKEMITEHKATFIPRDRFPSGTPKDKDGRKILFALVMRAVHWSEFDRRVAQSDGG